MRRTFVVFSFLLILGLVLSACSQTPAATPAAEEPAAAEPTAEVAVEEPAATEPEGCLGTAEGAVVDLDCREITIAVENAYLPFNYISRNNFV